MLPHQSDASHRQKFDDDQRLFENEDPMFVEDVY